MGTDVTDVETAYEQFFVCFQVESRLEDRVRSRERGSDDKNEPAEGAVKARIPWEPQI